MSQFSKHFLYISFFIITTYCNMSCCLKSLWVQMYVYTQKRKKDNFDNCGVGCDMQGLR